MCYISDVVRRCFICDPELFIFVFTELWSWILNAVTQSIIDHVTDRCSIVQ